MLRLLSDLEGWAIEATDGSIGSIHDFYFDESAWNIRWVVVDTGNWLPGRRVLLPPGCFAQAEPLARSWRVPLTRQQIEDSPGVDADMPVSRQMEVKLFQHYGYTPYWTAAAMPMGGIATPLVPPLPYTATAEAAGSKPGAQAAESGDPSLHSAREVMGSYYIHASDGEIGHVEDFLADETDWTIRYMVVDTKNWWPGKKVLVSPRWIEDVSWDERAVSVRMTRERVRSSPEYDPAPALGRDYETRLHGHYGFPVYWE